MVRSVARIPQEGTASRQCAASQCSDGDCAHVDPIWRSKVFRGHRREHQPMEDESDDDHVEHAPQQEHAQRHEEDRSRPLRELGARRAPSTATDCVATTGISQPPCNACRVSGLWGLVTVTVNSAYMITNHNASPSSQNTSPTPGLLRKRNTWHPRMQVAATLVRKPGPRP